LREDEKNKNDNQSIVEKRLWSVTFQHPPVDLNKKNYNYQDKRLTILLIGIQ